MIPYLNAILSPLTQPKFCLNMYNTTTLEKAFAHHNNAVERTLCVRNSKSCTISVSMSVAVNITSPAYSVAFSRFGMETCQRDKIQQLFGKIRTYQRWEQLEHYESATASLSKTNVVKKTTRGEYKRISYKNERM